MLGNALGGAGFSGWMADFGEYVPLQGVFASPSRLREERQRQLQQQQQQRSGVVVSDAGEDVGLRLHNAFPGLWAMTNSMARAQIDSAARLGGRGNTSGPRSSTSSASDDSVTASTSNTTTTSSSSSSSSSSSTTFSSSSTTATTTKLALANGSDLLYFSRSASSASLSHGSVFWAGDQLVYVRPRAPWPVLAFSTACNAIAPRCVDTASFPHMCTSSASSGRKHTTEAPSTPAV
jgi:hypothetical protein